MIGLLVSFDSRLYDSYNIEIYITFTWKNVTIWSLVRQKRDFEMKYFKELSLSGCCCSSLGLKYLTILTFSALFEHIFFCCRNFFTETFTNSIFLTFTVSFKFSSFSLENREKKLAQTMQYQVDLSCLRYSKICLFILLYLRCTQISTLSHWIESEFFATDWQHILHILTYFTYYHNWFRSLLKVDMYKINDCFTSNI